MTYQNQTTVQTENISGFVLKANAIDVQNTGSTVAYFDGIYIGAGTGRIFPLEVAGQMAKYESEINISFEGGAGNLIINQISYLNK